ncbi:hypothetical protein L6452_20419 [Arctium lappa]|uniref:Uncharacterized protein n=1 Tax=Arctium lappa TaxID=4217 RepID=A0ACB9BAH2_ARCLA|nr:hypothetical protein L6452_20419 [Arctium lappa]
MAEKEDMKIKREGGGGGGSIIFDLNTRAAKFNFDFICSGPRLRPTNFFLQVVFFVPFDVDFDRVQGGKIVKTKLVTAQSFLDSDEIDIHWFGVEVAV